MLPNDLADFAGYTLILAVIVAVPLLMSRPVREELT
jgi:hypothetical protein